jgi:hypothetical protein
MVVEVVVAVGVVVVGSAVVGGVELELVVVAVPIGATQA